MDGPRGKGHKVIQASSEAMGQPFRPCGTHMGERQEASMRMGHM